MPTKKTSGYFKKKLPELSNGLITSKGEHVTAIFDRHDISLLMLEVFLCLGANIISFEFL